MANEIVTDSACCLVHQAIAVCRAAHRNTEERAGEFWGLHVMLEGVVGLLEELDTEPSQEGFDRASNAVGGALTLTKLSDDRGDDVLIMALITLLRIAKVEVDKEWQAFEQSSLEVQPA